MAINDTESQEKLVFSAYLIQWSTLVFPPMIVVSLLFLLFLRRRISNNDIRTHVNWQLTTCAIIAAMIPLGLGLLFIGFSGVNTDAPISIFATFLLVGISFLFLPWLLYRLLRGTIRFSQQQPMLSMLP